MKKRTIRNCEGCNEREAIVKVLTLDRSEYCYLCEVCSELTLRYREALDDKRIEEIDEEKRLLEELCKLGRKLNDSRSPPSFKEIRKVKTD